MRITVEICDGIKSPHDGQRLLPQLKVTSTTNLSVYGLYDIKPNFLELKKEGELFMATFFLHENITAHCHSSAFNVFITNTMHFIGCLISNEKTMFTTTQEMAYTEESEERIADTLLNDFIIIQEMQTTTIETFRADKETDKHVRI